MLARITLGESGARAASGEPLQSVDEAVDKLGRLAEVGTDAVSYTHLDVYKRQQCGGDQGDPQAQDVGQHVRRIHQQGEAAGQDLSLIHI